MFRIPVVTLILCLLGCSSGQSPDQAAMDGAAPACANECPTCEAGHACVTLGTFGRLVPTCLKVCNSTADCAAGQRCILRNGALDGIAHCISGTVPASCEKIEDYAHCDFLGNTCRDATTLYQQVSRFGAFCGWEKLSCPNGCSPGVDGGTGARCQ